MRRVIALTDRIQAEITAAAQVVADMPAGAGGFLDAFVRDIGERAALVGRNAARDDGGDEGDDEGLGGREEAFPSSPR